MCPSETDSRAVLLHAWLRDELKLTIETLEPASSDASFRRYFRVMHNKQSQIVMDAPPDKENIEPFIRIAGFLEKAGIHVPQIHRKNLTHGFLLLEDLGCTSYLDNLNDDSADSLYGDAMETLWLLQTRMEPSDYALPSYDKALLHRELGIFSEWFLQKRLNISLPESLKNDLETLLINSALEQPLCFVHRDFHSRNLMIVPHSNPGVIDFQDAVIGPLTYDLVSLLRDCYIRWPEQRVKDWTYTYFLRLRAAGLLSVEFEVFLRWFDLMGLQRHLKAIGIFSRLDLRDNKASYLADIPRVFGYVQQVCAQYDELAAFAEFVAEQIPKQYLVTA